MHLLYDAAERNDRAFAEGLYGQQPVYGVFLKVEF